MTGLKNVWVRHNTRQVESLTGVTHLLNDNAGV